MYKGIRLGAAAAGEHWFVSCFLCFSAPFFSLPMYVSVGVCAWWFFSFSVPARLRFISLFFLSISHPHPQLLTRYVKTSTFSLWRGREPQLEKLSTTSVQLTPLVSSHDALANICSLSVQLSHSWCEYFFVWFSLDWSSLFLFKECFS